MSGFYTPQETAENVLGSCCKKAKLNLSRMLVLGILAGAYIALGAELSTFVTHDLEKHAGMGMSKLVAGSVFSVGLMLVVICGGELFTGNCLILGGVLTCRVRTAALIRNWTVIYLANFIGAVLVVVMMYGSGLWKMGGLGVGAAALKTASIKTELSFLEAFCRGVGCNWLVCLAVWMAAAAKDTTGKILGIYFPVMAFVASAFEHSIANMYFIPMGLMLKGNAAVVAAAGLEGALGHLTWNSFLLGNLLPVTLGNIVGGALFVAGAYHLAYLKDAPEG